MKRKEMISCSYSSFRRYIQNDVELSKLFKTTKSTIMFKQRFETEAGIQAQFDLKEKVPIIDQSGNKTRVIVATLILGFSRLNVRKIVPDTSYESVISFLAYAFDELGGVIAPFCCFSRLQFIRAIVIYLISIFALKKVLVISHQHHIL